MDYHRAMVEDLNKTQLVFLVLLVSFVTSIATGIITFSLLQEAPPVVTQTINRVVEQTIQQVVPSTNNNDNTNTPPPKVTTVVVKEDDRIISSIGKNTSSLVRVYNDDGTVGLSQFYSVGAVLSKEGTIVTASRDTFSTFFNYRAVFPDGSTKNLDYIGRDDGGSLDFFRVEHPTGTVPFNAGVPAVFSSEEAKLGQTVILLEGETKDVVTIGHVSDFVSTNPKEPKIKDGIGTDIIPKTNSLGGPLLNLSGEIIGFRTAPGLASSNQVYTSSFSVRDSITKFLKK